MREIWNNAMSCLGKKTEEHHSLAKCLYFYNYFVKYMCVCVCIWCCWLLRVLSTRLWAYTSLFLNMFWIDCHWNCFWKNFRWLWTKNARLTAWEALSCKNWGPKAECLRTGNWKKVIVTVNILVQVGWKMSSTEFCTGVCSSLFWQQERKQNTNFCTLAEWLLKGSAIIYESKENT